MNKAGHAVQNSIENPQKESLHGKKKSGPSRGHQNEAHPDDFDRVQGHYSKVTPHFDCSNLDVFFGGRPTQLKPATDIGFIGKVHSKKKSSDTGASKESHLRHPSSKDFSNFDELVENTTIINNPVETKPHSSKKSNEIPLQKLATPSEDASDLTQATFLEAALFKNHNKKKSREKSFSNLLKGGLKEDKTDQEIPEEISKLGLDTAPEEQEKADMTSFKDLKVTKNKVLERIKNKALPSHSRFGSITGNSFEPIRAVIAPGQLEPRTNNNSVFAGVNVSKLNKAAVSPIILQYRDQEIYNDDSNNNNDENKLINEIFENPKKNGNSEDIPLDKSKEISHNDLNPRLLTEKTGSKSTRRVAEINFDSSKGDRKKPNLSLISTDSTVDSDNFSFPQDHHNNSFSTPFSGASGSFNNSGKLDFNSPVRIDSGRINSENSEINYMQSYSMPKGLNMMIPRMSMIPTQRMSSNNLNQSCMSFCGGYGSSNNSDNSANLSFSEEFLNGAFNNSFNTPQGRQQPIIFNQSFNVPSNQNIMEQFYIAPQGLNDSSNFRNGSFNMNQSVSTQDRTLPSNKGTAPVNSDSKNASSRMRRKTQEAEDGSLYEINLNKVDNCGRTTLMVRNIPNKYDLTLILQTIDKNHKGKYDFFYLPIDFSNRCNFGYAFINFNNTNSIKEFYQEFNGKKWEKFNSEKICEIKYARIQGNTALMQHFQYSRVMNQQDKKLRPYIPPKYGFPNKQKLEELVRQQKLESAKNLKDKKAF